MNRITGTFGCLTTSKPLYTAVRFSSELFISRLSFYTTSEELKKMFSPFGVVKEARLVMDPKTRRNKGYGFVTFENEVEAKNALEALNGRIRAVLDMYPLLDDLSVSGTLQDCKLFFSNMAG